MRRSTVRYLTEEQAARIETTAQGKPCEVGIILALHYGLRLSDISHLRWSDIDFHKGMLCIDNGKGYRMLKMTEADTAYLSGLYSHRNALVSAFVWADVPGVAVVPYGIISEIRWMQHK